VEFISDEEIFNKVTKLFKLEDGYFDKRSVITYLYNLDEFSFSIPAIIPLGKVFKVSEQLDHLIQLGVCSSERDLKVKSKKWLADCFRISLTEYEANSLRVSFDMFESMLNCGFYILGLDLDVFENTACWELIQINNKHIRVPYGSLGSYKAGDDGTKAC
jgi:hypothetical protein